MFRLFYGMKRDGTCRDVRSHAPGSKREQFSLSTMKTLGSGDVTAAVKLPPGEDLNEWLASNTVDFFNEVRLIWEIITEVGVGEDRPGKGFPPEFEYRWADPKSRSNIVVSGPQYINLAIEWIEGEINNDALFPTSASTPFPSTFVQSLRVIYTRTFRIFAIIYSNHYSKLDQMGAASHLNTSFKHFLLFTFEYDLVKEAELEALHDIVQEIRSRYGPPPGRNKRESSREDPAPTFSLAAARTALSNRK